MKILLTGICGFVGSVLARELSKHLQDLEILGVDNLSRPGSQLNRGGLGKLAKVVHGDIRNSSDLEHLPKVDWVIDAAANPSVLAGVTTGTSSRQLMEHNLIGTINLLEFCKRIQAGMVMLSTSRVYSLPKLCSLPLEVTGSSFVPRVDHGEAAGLTAQGIGETFSTEPPLSLYGTAKLGSELLAREYAHAFGLPVHVNRCGVMAGAGQFGKPDQGIFSFWIHSFRHKRPLKYIGFDGTGYQVRDCLHPRDLAGLIAKQLRQPGKSGKVLNVGGGVASSISLARLSEWCAARFEPHEVGRDLTPRPFDVPWLVLDSSQVEKEWDWKPAITLHSILEEIADHADQHPDWLALSES
jgi:CDP-paratose 2-epimerase